MKKLLFVLLLVLTVVSTTYATEEKSKIGTVISIEFVPASKSEEVVKEWKGHTLITKKIIQINDEEYAVTVKYDNGETEIVYYDIEDFNVKVGDKVIISDDENA